ncbi:S9 family peptidase [Halobaculum limi]|uniref:S9 family peptidase n=1 Tax=Halobaculum limi TaxID=3031916 RepID=UPI002406CFF7|nr:prolyl oligopeptidase family serine peptidase [Halobaculum sp. YSMS11]
MSDTISIAEIASLPTFYTPVASEDGDEVAVFYDGSGQLELYTLDVETGERTRVSDGNVPQDLKYPPRFGPDGERIYFHADEGGDEQNDVMAIDRDGSVTPVVENDSQIVLADVAPDGRLLYASDEGTQMNLYVRHPDGETAQVTDYDLPVRAGVFDPSGEQIAYAANESADLNNTDAYVAAADGTAPRRLDVGEDGAETEPIAWHPDGDRLLLSDDSTDTTRCGVYDLTTDEVRWYTDDGVVESPVAFLADDERFVAERTHECAVTPVVYDVETGESRTLDVPTGVASFPYLSSYRETAVVSETEVLFSYETPTQRPRLVVYDVETDSTRTLMAPEYGSIDPDRFVDCSYERFESHDGLDIEALVYDAGTRPSPVVVKVHGGPAGQDQRGFDLYAQFLVDRGYSVLEVNYRGSTGRGRAFKNAINGDLGGAEQGDIAAGTRWIAEQEWVDEDRIAVVGGSYGGYSTFMQLLTYPDLYAAGIARVGITDWRALYEESMPHFQAYAERMLGDPEENADLYRERSPVTQVDNLDAPLCIVHGVNDPRCPISQARLFREKLEAAGFEEGPDFEYVELSEGHGSTDIDQKIRSFELMEEFLTDRVPVASEPAAADD